MIVVLSPSKTLDYNSPTPAIKASQPEFIDESLRLIRILRKLKPVDIATLMEVSENIARLNHQRFHDFSTPFTPDNARAALFAFKGDVYDGLAAGSYTVKDIAFAQAHLRILSGLYGILRPLDLMQAYRLEMGRALKNPRGDNLYQFWGSRLSETLNHACKASKSTAIINLASAEYWKAVDSKILAYPVITPIFKEKKGDSLKIIGLFAKRARGLMASYIIKNRITTVDEIKGFSAENYRFSPSLSTAQELIFTRKSPR